MKVGRKPWLIFFVLLLAALLFYFQQIQKEKYEGLELIPERTEDIPLYSGLEADSPVYKINGDHWRQVMEFYEKELPQNGWSLIMQQASPDSNEDGAGFISNWEKKGTDWVLSISGSYFKNMDQTEVTYDKRVPIKAMKWVESEVSEVCINEQPDRSEDCFKMTDRKIISQIGEMINEAPDAGSQQHLYREKSTIEFGGLTITVYYDLDEGIYFVSDKGTKWMKPEKEFFELTRISKEY
ncbi:hypothetical protein J7E38_18410 [Bacillus sp. ISL-35]|uniref:hypothetical protein n=1 Tax=Bacillus sp. ISL-35 TaxID=2819122 RepID=UPI001BE6A642|nr:hypothetical protein [Bacillus sp. ISL-35]MBT2680967.1 hypothetical protein [Bacillus sp. ISL-35]MBT2705286.1 hypothetical protein [Chryseobacterium sp. ISL-80]